MSKKFFALIVLCLSTYANSAPPQIPNQYHGFWATQEGCRQMNKDGIDAPYVEIKKSEINMLFNSSCKVKAVKKSDAQLFAGQFSCKGEEGKMYKDSIEISLSDASKLSVTNNNELKNLSLCKLKK